MVDALHLGLVGTQLVLFLSRELGHHAIRHLKQAALACIEPI